ncbi:MAG: class I SAM-dependent RNA methyltransferase [Neisseriaceae bacterium]
MITGFATTNKGLEQLLANELEELGANNVKITNAGAQFSANFENIIKFNLHSRFASRVMVQVGHSKYDNEEDIYNLANQINWQNWFDVNDTIKVNTTAINSPLKSLDFITLKVKDAICDKFMTKTNQRPNIDKSNPNIRIYNFLTKDTITIYIDTSGEGLFKRGYRQNKLEAPLKENLAAGLIALTNWEPKISFLDPMCGSGTIIIEAISKALNIAPGLNRNFAFEKIKLFDSNTWNSLKLDAIKRININTEIKIYGNDISQKAITITRENLNFFAQQLINLLPNNSESIKIIFENIQLDSKNILELNAPDNKGVMLTNPPYGKRLDEQEHLAKMYPNLASHLKNNYTNWNCYFLTSDLQMPKLMRLKPSKKSPIFNGALDCRLFEFKMVSGSNRDK